MVTLKEKLKYGNSCNSCLREVKRMQVRPEISMAGKAHG